MLKNLPANAGDIRVWGSISGSGRSPGGVHGHPLQDSCLENPMDRGVWWATVHSVAKSWKRLKRLSTHVFGKGATKGVIHRVPLKLQAKKNLQFQSPLFFFFIDRPCALLWGRLADSGKENERRVFGKGDSSSPDFQS